VDLGCGAGRDARELLRAGWRVLAVDREPAALQVLAAAAGPMLGARLETRVGIWPRWRSACDLVNASLCLPFLAPEPYAATWRRIVSALKPGSRFAAMLFGDRDESAADGTMTCQPPERIEADFEGFDIEYWRAKEEDSQTALGEPRHLHLIEVVARKVDSSRSRSAALGCAHGSTWRATRATGTANGATTRNIPGLTVSSRPRSSPAIPRSRRGRAACTTPPTYVHEFDTDRAQS